MKLEDQLRSHFGLRDVVCESLDSPTNDIVIVTAATDRFALKLYNTQSRTLADVQWELELVVHLVGRGAPVVSPVSGRHGYVETLVIDGQERAAALFEWARGEKPKADADTYFFLGNAAARIHQAADTFTSSLSREKYDATALIDDPLQRMKDHLVAAGRWQQMLALGERLRRNIASPALELGVCHMDLTLDNVHRYGDTLTVFDFDSAGTCWRALEPHGVLRSSTEYFEAWLEGYRSVRPFDQQDENAVAAFVIVGNLRVVAWDLGVARSSRGQPRLGISDLVRVVDDWLDWEKNMIPPH